MKEWPLLVVIEPDYYARGRELYSDRQRCI